MIDVYKILSDEGYENVKEIKEYQKNINQWNNWWRGYDKSFHEYQVKQANGELKKLQRKSMKMAKTISEDWANFLLNEKTYIKVDDKESQEWLTGDEVEQNGGILGSSKFWTSANRLIEKAYAHGTCAFILGLENPTIHKVDKSLKADSVVVRYIDDARMIIPLEWNGQEVYSCAFASLQHMDKKPVLLMNKMLKQPDGSYRVINDYYIEGVEGECVKLKENPNGVAKEYTFPVKPFYLVRPMINNNFDRKLPYGVSVFGNAIDQLEGCDLAYHNLFQDFYLGGKKVYVSQDALAVDEDNVPLVGDTVEQSLFYKMDEKVPGEKGLFQEYNPTLRVNENEAGIQLFLNLLSVKVGMGNHRYRFDRATASTATEVKANNKDLVESVNKQRVMIAEVLTEMIQAMLILGEKLCSVSVNPEKKISVEFDDSLFADVEAEKNSFVQEIREGIRQPWEYRVKFLGEDETTAKKNVGQSDGISTEYSE